MRKKFEKIRDWSGWEGDDMIPWSKHPNNFEEEEVEEEEDEDWDIPKFDKKLSSGGYSIDGNIADEVDDNYEVDGNANVPIEDNEEEALSKEDEMDNLCYLLRKFFTMSRTEAEVSYTDGIIDVFCFFERKEKMSSIMRCFEVVDKLKRDTLQGYSSTFEMWENREGYPVFNFRFAFGGVLDNGGIDEDDADAPWGDDNLEGFPASRAHNAKLQGGAGPFQ